MSLPSLAVEWHASRCPDMLIGGSAGDSKRGRHDRRRESELTPWSDVVGGIQTGDLMISSGSGTEDTVIEDVTGGPFSHAGMLTLPFSLS